MSAEANASTDGGQQLLLGKKLVERGLITPAQLQEALAERARDLGTGELRPIGVILVAKGYLTDTQLVQLLDEQAHRPPSSSSGVLPSFTAPSEALIPAATGGFSRLGKYELIRELGRGGMGIVYEAIDPQLNRKVALKLMLTNPTADAATISMEEERFVQEAQLSAKLKHPNIVTVYEAGILEGRRYLAMELVDGQPLSDWRRDSGAGIKQQIEVLRDVAIAVHHAHEQGILHRDLKPRNVLVGKENRAYVTDFGLAKSLGSAGGQSLTGSGAVVGTPAYMSPEQAQGTGRIDWRTDIWSLGVMLYEILTGRTPFRGDSPVETLMKIVKDPVPPPSSVVEGGAALALDRAVEEICMKALAKKDRDRYVTARAFAEDLTRWLAGEQVLAKAPKPEKRTPRAWPYIVGAAVGVVLVLGAAWYIITKPSVDAELAQARRFLELENFIDAASIYSGVLKVDPKNKEAIEGARRARELDAARKDKERQSLRNQLEASQREAEEARKKAEEEERRLNAAKTEEDRKRAATRKAEAEERARLADAAARKLDEQIRIKTTIRPAVADLSGLEEAWKNATSLLSLVELPRGVVWGTWSVQDNKLMSDRESFARIELPYVAPEEYDARLVFTRLNGAGEVAFILPGGGKSFSVELGGWKNTSNGFQSFRGARRADHGAAVVAPCALQNRKVYTLEVQVRKENVSAKLDGRPLLPGGGGIDLKDLSLDPCWKPRMTGVFALGSNGSSVVFHRLDLLTVSGEGTKGSIEPPAPFRPARVGLKNLKPGLVATYYYGTNFEVPAVIQIDPAPAFSWNLGPAWKGGPVDAFSCRWTGYLRIPKPGKYSFSLASDDGARLFIDGAQIISNWKVNAEPARSGFLVFEEGYHPVTVEYFEETYNASIAIFWTDSVEAAPSPVPSRLLFHDSAQLKPFTPPKFLEAQASIPAHSNSVTAGAFSPDGKLLATASEDKKVKLWDVAGRLEVTSTQGHSQGVLCVCFSPDGKLVASGGWDNRIRLWDVATGQEVKALEGHAGFVGAVAFSPNGKLLASGSFDQTIRLWDMEERQLAKTLSGHSGSVEGLAFSPDGKILASASLDHTVRLWDIPEGREVRLLASHADGVQGVAFAPDGKKLATCGWDGLIKFWDPASGKETLSLSGHSSEVMTISFSPDGKLLASGGNDCMVRIWNASSGRELRVLPGHTGRVMSVSFAREGRLLVSTSFDSTARLWDLSLW